MRNSMERSAISEHMEENIWLYAICLVCFFTGIVIGIYTVKYMGAIEKKDLTNYFVTFETSLKSTAINRKYILLEILKNNIPIILGIWFLGITIVGIPVILIIDIIKGFTLGFTIAFIMDSLGYKGIWFILMGVVPQNIFYVPCILVGSVLAIRLSVTKLKDKFMKQPGYRYIDNSVFNYSIVFVIICLCMMFGFMYELYITPGAIKAIVMKIGSGI
ncbi:stage II sporulation protein M [Clostridium oryzae]|uniref:Stage II sporulation protein M n=1 Tax=Clostridium oryzae TaxID=1450648 RepID=A0A1V4ITR0_9CLOT|nr:stage II sporulation protein M [Clostridium oryzae]OPJ63190.1 stage II sporulation protein M [Clostridium oryzae]